MALSRRRSDKFSTSIWPGFVDAMTALLLVLMFVLSIFMIVQFMLSETITGQESELDLLTDEVAQLADALGLERNRSADLERQVGVLDDTLVAAQSEADAQSAMILALTSQIGQQKTALTDAATRITGFESQVAQLLLERDEARAEGARLTDDVAALEDTRDALTEARDALSKDRDALETALAAARGEIDSGVEAARLAAAKREALEALIADLEREKDNVETQSAARLANAEALQEQLGDEEAARLAEAAAAQALREKLAGAEDELTAMTLALEEQRRRAEETLTLLAAAETAGADLDEKLAAAILAGAELKDLLGAETEAGQSKAEALGESEAEVGRLRDALAAAEAERARLTGALEDARGGQVSNAAALSEAEKEITALSTELVNLRSRGAALVSRLASAEQDTAALAEAEAQVATLSAALETERTAVAQLTDERDTAIADGAGASVALAGAQRTIETLSRDIADLRTEVSRLASENASLRASTGDADSIRNQLAAALAAKIAAEQLSREVMTAAERQEALLAAARTQLSQEEAQSAESQRKVTLLNQQVAALRSDLAEIERLLESAEARDSTSNVQVQELGARLNRAMAQLAMEQDARARLEETERRRLEEEKKRLEEEAKNLANYRSEFFGQLRQILGGREGVRIEGDRFVFSSEVLFEPASARISDQGRAQIAHVAGILGEISDDIPEEIDWVIRVDGHTDDSPLSGQGEFADNWELSQARALSVVRFMTQQLGFEPERLAANGFGEFQPVSREDTPEARARNRRIELKLTER